MNLVRASRLQKLRAAVPARVSAQLLLMLCLLGTGPLAAQTTPGQLIRLDTRPGVQSSYWWMPHEAPTATVLLMSGGVGGIGFKDGQPASQNFLIRSRAEFFRAGFNVALLGNPGDMRQLNPDLRISPEHVQDIAAVVTQLRQKSSAPVWLVGTSQGSISATAAALSLGSNVAGLVLSSSYTVVHRPYGAAVTELPLEKLAVPVLVHQHGGDGCPVTPAWAARALLKRLRSAPVAHYAEVSGGSEPSGSVCEALHYHGYIGIEAQVVREMARWMTQPVSSTRPPGSQALSGD